MRHLISTARGRSALLLTALAAVVSAVLLHGASRRHARGPAPAPPAPAPEASARVFHAELEKTPLSYFSDYWLQLGNRVRSRLVLVGARRTPALVVGPDLAVSTFESADGDESAAAPGPHRLLAADAAAGLAVFELGASRADRAFQAADSASVHPGMLVAAVSIDPRGRLEVMPGYLISVAGPPLSGEAPASEDSLEAFVPLPPSARAAAIVDLDGYLVGAAFRSRGSTRFFSAESLLRTVERLRAHPTCRSLEVADLDDRVRKLSGLDGGVAVERVHREAFLDEPSIRAGDVLLEWNGHKVSNAAEFEGLYDAGRPGAAVPYLVQRGRRPVHGRTSMPGPNCRPLGDPPASFPGTGLTLVWDSTAPDGDLPSSTWSVAAVAPGSPAQRAGIQPDDRILSADASKPDREDVLRRLDLVEKQGRPVVLTLWRAGRVKLVALAPEGN